jgi:hypothetical protein
MKTARIIFAMDATASRESAWDAATSLTGRMFDTAADVGKLSIQLVYYRGISECRATQWFSSVAPLKLAMSRIMCRGGETQILRVLDHAKKEHAKCKVDGLVFVGDCVEESFDTLCAAAHGIGMPAFFFQECDNQYAAQVFAELARITGGAHLKFDAGAVGRLGDLLGAVATFATGGLPALTNQGSEGARLLLTQLKK